MNTILRQAIALICVTLIVPFTVVMADSLGSKSGFSSVSGAAGKAEFSMPVLNLAVDAPTSAVCGDNIIIEIRAASGYMGIGMLQYSVDYDETKFQYVSYSALTIDGDVPSINAAVPGSLTYSWADGMGACGATLTDGTSLITLTLKVISSSGPSVIDITGSPTTIQSVDCVMATVTVTTNSDSVVLSGPVQNTNTLATYCNLQAAIVAASPGQTIKLLQDISEGLVYINKALTLDGNSKTLTSTSSISYGIEVGSPNVNIHDLTVFDATTFGIQVDCGSDNLVMTNVTVNSCQGTGISMNGSDNIMLINITSTNNNGNGMSVTNCDNLTINGITTSGNSFGGGFSAGIGLFTSSIYCLPAGINGFTLTGAISIAEPAKVYSQKASSAHAITGLSGASITWAVGTSATDRSYWPSKAVAYAVVDGLFEFPYFLPNSTVYVAEVATENFYVDDDPNGDSTPPMSIQTAINFQVAGQTIFVESGVFNERLTVDKSITIDGDGFLSTVLSGTGLVGTGSGISLNAGITDITIRDFSIINFVGSDPLINAGIRGASSNSNLTIQNMGISNNIGGSGIYLSAVGGISNVLIENVEVSGHPVVGNPARGIVIWDGHKSNITIRNCTVYNNSCCGIELQDGTSTGVTLENNNVYNNGDNGIAATGLTGPGANIIKGNTVSNNGRFGIEIKLPNGSGAVSGAGSIVIENNTVYRSTVISDTRDIAGIAVFRRAFVVAYNNVNIPTGVVVRNNTVYGYQQPSSSDGFGIVIEGTNHTVTNNTVYNNSVGIQQQAGHLPYTENTNVDGDQTNLADQFFGRGNTPFTCGNTIASNTFTGGPANGVDSRNVGPGVNTLAGLVKNTANGETFCSIQVANNDSNTDNGNTITVAAGTYVENISITKSLNILGPNENINPNTGSRLAEAIVIPAVTALEPSTTGAIFRLGTTSHIDVTIKGLTINGSNPALGAGRMLNGVPVHTGAGIVNSIGSFDVNPGGRDVKMTIQNNIIKNLERYGVLADGVTPVIALAGTDVSFNKIDNLPSGNNFGGGRGRAIAFEENHYGSATHNVISRVNVGWQDDNYYLASPGAGTVIDNNTISTYHRGIFHNLQYSGATDATITNNNISVETSGDFPASTTNFGLELASIQGTVGATVSNNNSTGNTYGILLWNLPTSTNINVTGGTMTGNQYGILATSNDPQFGAASPSTSTVSGVNITGSTVAGIAVDNSSNTAAVNLTIKDDCEIVGTGHLLTGVAVLGPNANATIKDNDASIHGFAIGIDVNGGSATITNNHIYDNGIGVRFTNAGAGTVNNLNNFDGGGNPDNGRDIQATASAGLVSATPNNSFAGDIFGVENLSATNIDASYSYWESASGPGPVAPTGTGANITTRVLYCPWLNAAPPGGMPVGPVKNTTTMETFCTIQAAIDDADTGTGHTITVEEGTYNEQVLVNKQVIIQKAGVTKPIINFTGTPALVSGRLTAFEVTVPNVTINGFEFKIDVSKLGSAIIASVPLPGSVSNLQVLNNDINPYRSSGSTVAYAARNAVNINFDAYRVGSSNPSGLLVQGNTVSYNYGVDSTPGTLDDAGFRSGIATDEGAGTFTGNTLQTINHDIVARFTNAVNSISITSNNFNGGGLTYTAPNSTGGSLTITLNTFNGAFSNTYSSMMRLQDNIAPNTINTMVGNNVFINTQWAASIENYGNITFNNNTFTPVALSTTFRHLTINTKENASSSSIVTQTAMGGTFTNNTFNGSLTPGGTALMFLNHDSDNDTYGTYTIGTAGNENNFNANITNMVKLDNQTGSSNGSVFPVYPNTDNWPTTMACWDQNLDMRYNKFDVGAGLQLPGAMNFVQRTALEAALTHKPDNACLGLITYFLPVHNLTQNTYYLTIQEAIIAANNINGPGGDVIECAEWTFNERVTIDRSVTIQGITNLNTILTGSGLAGVGSGFIINNGVTNVTIKNFTIQNFAGSAPNSYAGIYAIGGNNSLLVDNNIIKDNVGGCGFYANGPVNGVTITNNKVSGHSAAFGQARGIVIWNGFKQNIVITGNEVFNNTCCGIELQEGNATNVNISNNNIHDNIDSGIGLIGLAGPGSNLVNNNIVSNNGRFGIEIKNPNGNNTSSGPGSVVVSNNTVSRNIAIVNDRDIAGIAVFRRTVLSGNVDVPYGAWVSGNTVSGYTQPSNSDGFGIVVEGMSHTVTNNTVTGNDVGIQRQAGHLPYVAFDPLNPGLFTDGDQNNLADTYFGRGNAPYSCNLTLLTNTVSGNTVNTRDVGNVNGVNIVTNTNTIEPFCTIQQAINDAQTVNTHVITAPAGTYVENVIVNKEVTITGAGKGSNPATNTVLSPLAACGGVGITVSASNVTVQGMYVTNFQNAVLLNGVMNPTINNMALVDYCVNGLLLGGNSSNIGILNTDIQRTSLLAGTIGITGVNYTDAVNGMVIDNCTITGNALQGMAFFQHTTPVDFDDIVIKNSTISNNRQKGMYFEKLSNATFDNLIMDNNGIDPTYGFNNGIDINLKYDSYANITIKNSSITNSGVNGIATDPQNPCAIAIKARDDASSYNTNPATLTNVMVKNNFISGPVNGIRIGEFGKTNNSPTNVEINNNHLGSGYSNDAIVNRVPTMVDATCNWFGTTGSGAIGALVFGSVDYSPYLISGTDDGNPANGFQPAAACSTVTTFYVDDNSDSNDIYTPGATGNDANSGSALAPFLTIQHAINVAGPGDNIYVDAGSFTQQLQINKSLNIIGAGRSGVSTTSIKAPAVFSDVSNANASNHHPIVYASGLGNTINISNVLVDGDGGRNIDRFMGVYYFEANGTFDNSRITGIRDVVFSGVQRGLAFVANHTFDESVAQTVSVTNNIIDDYQKGGIVINELNTQGIITGNTVTGQNLPNVTGQNGIQLGFGAYGTITNNTVTNNLWNSAHPHVYTAAGILLAGVGVDASNTPTGNVTTIGGNYINGNENGMLAAEGGFGYASNAGVVYTGDTYANNKVHVSLYDPPTVPTGSNTYDKRADNPDQTNIVFGSVQYGVDYAAPGDQLNVSSGHFIENVNVHQAVDLIGANYGVVGCMGRAAESHIDGLAGIGVDITSDDVSLTGFRISGSTGVKARSHIGVTVKNNKITTLAAGIDAGTLATTGAKNLELSGNCIELTSQAITPTTPTAGVYLSEVTGMQAPVVSNNFITGPFFGYLLYSVNATPATDVDGGSITGAMQGVAILNIDPISLAAFAPSKAGAKNITMSGFTGVHPSLPNNNFHAGVYTFTGGPVTTAKLISVFAKLTISGTGKIAGDCAGMSFADFSTGAGNRQDITVNECNLTNNLNRGINIRGANALVDINADTLTGNGGDPYGLGGNEGFGIIAREAAVVTIDNCFITNPSSVTAPNNVTAIAADAGLSPTVTITASNNSILPNLNLTSKLASNSGGTFMATCNWWGSAIAATVSPYIVGAVTYQPFLTTGVDNDIPTAGFQPVPNSCNACVSTITNTNTGITYCSIQSAIDDSQTLAGHTITVPPGTYVENITVHKSLTILGPKVDIDADTRFAAFVSGVDGPKADPLVEAIITAGTNNPSGGNPNANDLIRVVANGVTINGFVIDGNNPAIPGVSGTIINGVDIDARRALTNLNGSNVVVPVNNMNISYNIMQNFGQRAVSLSGAAALTGNSITENVIRNFKEQGVLLLTNAYVNITNNTLDVPGEAIGLHLQNFDQNGSMMWHNNNVTVGQDGIGIHANLFYAPTGTLTISSNTVNAATGVTGASDFTWGINVWSVQVGSTVTLSNNMVGNTITGGELGRGINLWNLPTSNTVSVTGGSVAKSILGINLDAVDPYFGAGSTTTVNVANVTVTASNGQTGIQTRADDINAVIPTSSVTMNITGATVNSSPGATSIAVKAPLGITSTIDVSNSSLTGGTSGILVSGMSASANIHDNSSTITGALIGVDVDGGTATLTANNITANGIGVRVKNGGVLNPTTNNFITNNTTDGISIEVSAGAIGVINNNDLSGNTSKAINSASASTIAATCNWYGFTVPATIAGKISGIVNYVPWLISGVDDGNDPANGFQPAVACAACALVLMTSPTVATCPTQANGTVSVTVSSGGLSPYTYDWTGTPMGDGTTAISALIAGTYTVTVTDINGCTESATAIVTNSLAGPVHNVNTGLNYCTIQAAINDPLTLDNHVINVDPGTYPENVTLNKKLTINGAQSGITACGRIASESIITGSGVLLYLGNNSAGSILDGLTFSGGTRAIESNGGPLDNLIIKNNRFVGFTNNGIFLNDGGKDITVHQNSIDGTSKIGGGALFHLDTDNFSGLHFTNNCVSNSATATGLFVDGNRNVGTSTTPRSPLIQGNLFQNLSVGINAGSRALENAQVLENTFNNNTVAGFQGGPKNSNFARNTFSNNGRYGMSLTAFGSADPLRGGQGTTIQNNFFFNNATEPGTLGVNYFGDILLSNQTAGTQNSNTISNNSLLSTIAIYNNEPDGGTDPIHATCNWFGTTSPVGVAAKIVNVSGGITLTVPWLISGTDDDMVTPGFQASIACAACTLILNPSSTVANCPLQNDGTASVSVTSGGITPYTYDWVGTPAGDGTATITGLTAGSYTVTVSDINGCTESATAIVANSLAGPVHNTNTLLNYCTIQSAINDPFTLATHTITVDAGTYPEEVVISKAITLTGAGAATTFIDKSGSATAGNIVTIAGISGNVELSGFTIKTGDASAVASSAITASGNTGGIINIHHNILTAEQSAAGTANANFGLIAGYGSTSALIFDNNIINGGGDNPVLLELYTGPSSITNNTIYRGPEDAYAMDAIFIMNYGAANITTPQIISGNTIDLGGGTVYTNGTRSAGISFAAQYTGGAGPGGFTNVTISNNIIQNLKTSRRGISLWDNSNGAGDITATISGNVISAAPTFTGEFGIRILGSITGTIVNNNTISGVTTAFLGATWPASGSPTGALVNYNSFAGSGTGINWTGGTGNLYGVFNWWGSATGPGAVGPGTGALVTAMVDYCPWLDAAPPAGLPTSTAGVGLNIVQNTITGKYFCSIQAAIDDSETINGHNISVGVGTYTENVIVNKEVAITGAGYTTKVISVTTNGNIMTIAANNVTLNNMHLEGTPIMGSSATRGIYFNSAVNNTTITNVKSSLHQFAMYADNSADLNGLMVTNAELLASGNGFHVEQTGKVTNLTINGGSISDNLYGFSGNVLPGSMGNDNGLTNVSVTNTVFNNNQIKGLYFEKLKNATFDNISVTNNGNGAGNQNGGFDINLKGGAYSNIDIINSTISGNGLANDNGAGLFVKARTTGSAASNPATLDDVMIANNFITGNGVGLYGAGIRIGESNNSFTGVEVGPINVEIHNNTITGNAVHAIRNATSSLNNINATCNWFGSTTPTVVASGISGAMTYIPWLISGMDDVIPNPGFQPAVACVACTLTISASDTDVTCSGLDDGMASAMIVIMGVSPYTYAWSNGAVSSSIMDLSPGVYTVTVTDINGCTQSTSVTITEPTDLEVSGTVTHVSCFNGNDGAIDINVSGGTPGYTYMVTGPDNIVIPYNPNGYTLGELDGQNGWDGGLVGGLPVLFNNDGPGDDEVTNAMAHSGTQSWKYSRGYGSPGAGTPFTPVVASVGRPSSGAAGDKSIVKFAFKVVTPTDGSVMSVYEGSLLRDDRTGGHVVLEAKANGNVEIKLSKAIVSAPYFQTVSLGEYPGNVWHELEMSTIYPNTVPGDINTYGTTTYKLDGLIIGSEVPWTHWWREQNVYAYSPGSSLKFSNTNSISQNGFYIDDLSMEIKNTTLGTTVGYFGTGFETGADLDNLIAGDYTVKVTDANGCMETVPFTITQPTELTLALGSNSPICSFETLNLTSTAGGGTPGYTYNWTGPNGFASSDEDPSIVSATSLASGTYLLTITDANGCIKVGSLNVTVYQDPLITLNHKAAPSTTVAVSQLVNNPNTITICSNTSVSIEDVSTTTTTPTGSLKYQMIVSGDLVDITGEPVNSVNAFAVSTPFSGILKNISNANKTVTFTFTPFIDLNDDGVKDVGECSGVPVVVSYLVRPEPDPVPITTIQACSATTYSFDLDNYIQNNGPGLGQVTYTYNVSVIPNLPFLNPDPTQIGGSSANGMISNNINNFANQSLTVRYTVTPTSAFGCVGNVFIVDVVINPKPQVNVNVNGDNTLCQGELRTVFGFVFPANTYTYEWKFISLGYGNATLTNSTSLSPLITAQTDNTNSLTLQFKATNTLTGCADSIAYVFTVSSVPSFGGGQPLNLSSCETLPGSENAVFNLTSSFTMVDPPAAMVTYHTSASDAAMGVGAIMNPTMFTGTNGQEIWLRLTNGGCFITTQIVLTVHLRPNAFISGDLAICIGENTTLTATGAGVGGNYLWSNSAITPATMVNPVVSTSYTVTATDVNGCSNTSSVTVVVNNCPVQNPDLLINFDPTNTIFNTGNSRDIVITLNEVNGVNTTGTIQLFLAPVSGYTFNFYSTQISANIEIPPFFTGVNNPEWTAVPFAGGLLLTSNAIINANGLKKIAVSITAIGSSNSNPINAIIFPGSGGESNSGNNGIFTTISTN